MSRYYTRVCNFYYGSKSINLVNKKKTFPLNGNKEISFDQIEIISRKNKKKISIKKIKNLSKFLKKKNFIRFKINNFKEKKLCKF